MKTNNSIVQGLINYLEKHLCGEDRKIHKFKKVGPRCFFFQDKVDTIFVKVTDKNLIIINDGEHVSDCEISQLIPTANNSDATEDELYNYSLQTILHFF